MSRACCQSSSETDRNPPGCGPCGACDVVDQQVDAAEFSYGGVDEVARPAGSAEVYGDGEWGDLPEFGADCSRSGHDLVSLIAQCGGDGQPEALASARDDGVLVIGHDLVWPFCSRLLEPVSRLG